MFLPLSRNLTRPASWAVLALALAACSAQPVRSPAPATHEPGPRPAALPSVGERAAVVAARQVGAPYRYGGSSERGFDCSGLVYYAYARAGKQLPRTTSALWRETRPVGRDELAVGDLLFFNIAGKMAHVGLYLGERRFVHAPSSGREVTIASLDSDFYRRAFIRGGRPL